MSSSNSNYQRHQDRYSNGRSRSESRQFVSNNSSFETNQSGHHSNQMPTYQSYARGNYTLQPGSLDIGLPTGDLQLKVQNDTLKHEIDKYKHEIQHLIGMVQHYKNSETCYINLVNKLRTDQHNDSEVNARMSLDFEKAKQRVSDLELEVRQLNGFRAERSHLLRENDQLKRISTNSENANQILRSELAQEQKNRLKYSDATKKLQSKVSEIQRQAQASNSQVIELQSELQVAKNECDSLNQEKANLNAQLQESLSTIQQLKTTNVDQSKNGGVVDELRAELAKYKEKEADLLGENAALLDKLSSVDKSQSEKVDKLKAKLRTSEKAKKDFLEQFEIEHKAYVKLEAKYAKDLKMLRQVQAKKDEMNMIFVNHKANQGQQDFESQMEHDSNGRGDASQ